MNATAVVPELLIREPAYEPLKEHLVASIGLAYYVERDQDLAGRLARRMVQLGLSGCGPYLDLLLDGQRGEAELDELTEELTIGETYFFRHRELFRALEETVLPDIIHRNRDRRRLRIWSAGCSIGAEPYSIAILLKRVWGHLIGQWDITILGTDISRRFLATARKGQFPQWAFRATPEEVRQACFRRVGKEWQIGPEFQQWVSFAHHNLVQQAFPSLQHNLYDFDLIICRNVMIYFRYEIIRELVAGWYKCLADEGWLLVGHAESNVELFRAFRTINAAGAVLYQRPPAAPGPPGVEPAGPLQSWLFPFPQQSRVPPPATGALSLPPAPAAKPPAPPPAKGNDPPDALRSELARIRALADQGQLDRAIGCCKPLLEKHRLQPAVHWYYALLVYQKGLRQETERALRRVLYLDRNHALAHYYLGRVLQEQGQAEQAARSFRNVLGLLSAMPGDRFVPDAGELTVADLQELTGMHLDPEKQKS